MENEKNPNFEDQGGGKDAEFESEVAPRARNRTVMLTPDVTGEVRARLAQELGQAAPAAAHRSHSFEAPAARPAGGYMPVGEIRQGRQEHASHAAHAAPQPAANREGAVWVQESPLVGFLVAFDSNPNGTVFELRSGRLIVTSESVGVGNYLLIKDSSVSPMHAIIRITRAGEIQVLDQLSEFGTRVQRFGSESEEELSGEKTTLEHGDIIKFGQRRFHVCVIARSDQV